MILNDLHIINKMLMDYQKITINGKKEQIFVITRTYKFSAWKN